VKKFSLLLGDCIELMGEMSPGTAKVIFADPPFNVNRRYAGFKDRMGKIDYEEWTKSWVRKASFILSEDGTLYVMTLPRHIAFTAAAGTNAGLNFVDLIAWKNAASSNDGKSFWSLFQPILMFTKSKDATFNRYAQTRELPKSSWNKARRAKEKGQMGNIWEDIPKVYSGSITHPEAILIPGTNKKKHSCQMPIGLPERAILFSSNPGDTVLDPFCGSGSTGVAALENGRNFIGIDISQECIDMTHERCNMVG